MSKRRQLPPLTEESAALMDHIADFICQFVNGMYKHPMFTPDELAKLKRFIHSLPDAEEA